MVIDPMVERESAQDQVIADKERRGLSYEPLDLGVLYNVHPNLEMGGFLWEHMEFDWMIDEVMTAC